MPNFVHIDSSTEWHSAESAAIDLCRALRADGWFAAVFCRNKPAVYERFASEELLYGVMAMRGPLGSIVGPVRLRSFIDRLEGRVTLHISNPSDLALAAAARRLSRRPAEISIVMSSADAAPKAKNLDELDAVVFESPSVLEAFAKLHPEVNSAKLHCLTPSIASEPAGDKNAEEPVEIVFGGHIAPDKSLDLLIAALGRLGDQPWHLTIAGSGQGRYVMPQVRASRAVGAERIEWVGQVDDILPHLRKARIAFCPAGPRPVLEAMSQGCVPVTFAGTAAAEIIADGENGLTVKRSADALADGLRRLISERSLIDTMGERALADFAAHHPYSQYYADMHRILSQPTTDNQ